MNNIIIDNNIVGFICMSVRLVTPAWRSVCILKIFLISLLGFQMKDQLMFLFLNV